MDTTKGDRMLQVYSLELLTPQMGNCLCDCTVAMLSSISEHELCPKPLRSLLHFYKDRGGYNLGIFWNFKSLLVESGGQLFDKISVAAPHEFLMCDMEKYNARVAHVNSAFGIVHQDLHDFFGHVNNNNPVKVKMGASWNTDNTKFLNDGRPRLELKPVVMESILGRKVDMTKVDTIPYGPTGSLPKFDEKWSPDGYSDDDLALGRHCFEKMVDGMEMHTLLVLDSNQFLFHNNPRGSLKYLVHQKGYHVKRIVWNYEAVLLFHTHKQTAIWLHLPVCKAADAFQHGKIEYVTRQCSIVHLTTMVVAWYQEGDHVTCGKMDCSFHDGVFAGYARNT